MGTTTGIEWTDATWNPIRGCTRVSEGCRNCYAEQIAGRFSGPGLAYEGLATFKGGEARWTGDVKGGEARWTGDVQFVEKHLRDPLKWKEPRKIFVNSMSDLFHEGVSTKDIYRIFMVMWAAHQHTFQILTKRPERMQKVVQTWLDVDKFLMEKFAPDALPNGSLPRAQEPLSNVWFGVSVEDQQTADSRIPWLLNTPAAVRFISYEPAIGPIDWNKFLFGPSIHPGLDWIICGGESGPEARPMHPDWARETRTFCSAFQIPFFFKQWGEWSPTGPIMADTCAVGELGTMIDPPIAENFQKLAREKDTAFDKSFSAMYRVGKNKSGAVLDGVEWKEFPKCG